MGGEQTRPMWVPILLVLVAATAGTAICPSRCRCNEDALHVSCAGGALAVVPIQLNPEVRHIDLSDNKISSVHFTLGFYDKLQSLDLSMNKIQSLGAGNFDAQRNMRLLNLSSNEVEVLSKDSFKGLRALSVLDLSYNRLEEIAAYAFRDLHSIEVLKLTGNQIVYLEEGLFKPATMLRELLMESNQLLDIPSGALADAYNLQRLALSQNLIATIDEGDMPTTLTELQVLQLDSNVIGAIRAGALSGLTALEYLDLSNNNFTSVPTVSLAKLSNLTKLIFSENFISTVPPVAFRGLFQLRTLLLNRLDFLTHIDSRAFVDNINLETISLDDNIAVENLPHRLFYGNPRIAHISMRNNQIATLDASHFPLDQLSRLQLGGNPLQCNCSLLWLWRLGAEQRARPDNSTASSVVEVTAAAPNSRRSNTHVELSIDIDDIVCAGPEPLMGARLIDTYESQIGCSLGWLAVIAGISLTFLLLAIAIGALYCGPLRKRFRRKAELPPIENVSTCANGQGLTTHHTLSHHHHHPYDTTYNMYEDPRVEKYIIGPPLIHDYRALPQWDPCSKHCDENDVYKQFDNNINNKTRPHIVYV